MRLDIPAGRRRDPGDILEALYRLVDGGSRASSAAAIYDEAFLALSGTVAPDRVSVLTYDDRGVMRFRAWRGLSEAYRRAVEGHSPWLRGTTDPQPVVVPDVQRDEALADYRPLFRAEGLGAMAFIPLVADGE